MQHPFEVLRGEYAHLLSVMQVREECRRMVDEVAAKLLGYKSRYAQVSAEDGVPVVFIATLFEREASSNFTKNPAQGWPLHSVSKWVPHNGPFPDWNSAALAAYHLNGLDKVGPDNWTWELMCFYGELFNGMGYRDFHHMHSPYLWGGTNIQTVGKYDADEKFNPDRMDPQLGIVPVMRRMVELDASLALSAVKYVPAPPIASGLTPDPNFDARWVQTTLNKIGFDIDVDGSYGRDTKIAVERFQQGYGIEVDGLAGPKTIAALRTALATFEAAEKTA